MKDEMIRWIRRNYSEYLQDKVELLDDPAGLVELQQFVQKRMEKIKKRLNIV